MDNNGTTIECDGERFMYAPDIQGPMVRQTAEFILNEKPDVLMVGGPPFYLGGLKVSEIQLRNGVANLSRISETVPVTVIEHHPLRNAEWRTRTEELYSTAEKVGHRITTAAEFAGEKNQLLESKRKQLYTDFPPSKDFLKWTRENQAIIGHLKPPI